MDIRTAYEEVLYRAQPFNQTHPSRLFALATLFGLEPAPLDRCRVLEVACADGGNLIPMAAEFPGSEFVGFDLAETVIRAGQEDVAALGLTNIRLEPMDLMDAGAALGSFDYVIAHGLYSWVPEPVRDRLMALVKASLTPRGVAYVSYNALPGCRIREMFRDMMLFHVRDLEESDQRLYGAREFLECFVAAQAGFERPRQYLTEQAQVLIDQGPVVLFHDELGVVYHPVYFHEFLAHADRHGLQYLSEANYYNTQAGKIPANVAAEVDRLTGGNRILREQYFDFLKCRMFRQTLLCHAGTELPGEPLAERVSRLAAASPAKPVSARPDLGPTAEEEFPRLPRGGSENRPPAGQGRDADVERGLARGAALWGPGGRRRAADRRDARPGGGGRHAALDARRRADRIARAAAAGRLQAQPLARRQRPGAAAGRTGRNSDHRDPHHGRGRRRNRAPSDRTARRDPRPERPDPGVGPASESTGRYCGGPD